MDERAERLARGDPAAFVELYDACADRIHHYLVVRLASRADADDVLLREISEVTGLPQGTVATRYRSALEKIRHQMAKESQ